MSLNNNLIDELEKLFQGWLQHLISKEVSSQQDVEEEKASMEQCLEKFVEKSQEVESYFLQKCHVYSVYHPEYALRAENAMLKMELRRKDELLQKHTEHLAQWHDQLKTALSNKQDPTQGQQALEKS